MYVVTYETSSKPEKFLLDHALSMDKVCNRRLFYCQSSCGSTRRFNKLMSVFYASVLLLIMNFVITIVKVIVDQRGNSRVDPQTTLTML